MTVAQIMNSLLPNSELNWRKVGKTTRPFRYDLNQIPYDYEVRNRFKGPDLLDRVPDELWTEFRDIVQETGIKTIPAGVQLQEISLKGWMVSADNDVASDSSFGTTCLFQASGFLLYFDKCIRSEVWHF